MSCLPSAHLHNLLSGLDVPARPVHHVGNLVHNGVQSFACEVQHAEVQACCANDNKQRCKGGIVHDVNTPCVATVQAATLQDLSYAVKQWLNHCTCCLQGVCSPARRFVIDVRYLAAQVAEGGAYVIPNAARFCAAGQQRQGERQKRKVHTGRPHACRVASTQPRGAALASAAGARNQSELSLSSTCTVSLYA